MHMSFCGDEDCESNIFLETQFLEPNVSVNVKFFLYSSMVIGMGAGLKSSQVSI
jgi:hypothetical protein